MLVIHARIGFIGLSDGYNIPKAMVSSEQCNCENESLNKENSINKIKIRIALICCESKIK